MTYSVRSHLINSAAPLTYVDQDSKGRKTCRPARGAADEVRAGDQSENGQANRFDDSTERNSESG